jgi:hypothetical protein
MPRAPRHLIWSSYHRVTQEPGQERSVAPVGGRTRHQSLECERVSPTRAAAGDSSWADGWPKKLHQTARSGPTVTYAERILDYVWSVAPDGATNGELARHLGIRSHQTVYMLTQELMRAGRIRGQRSGTIWVFHAR